MDADRIALLLPEVYRQALAPGSPLAAVLDVMADLHAPVEETVAHLPSVFDPWTAPDRFVPFLARWVDLARWLDDDELATGNGRLRVLVALSAELSRRRGTAGGLQHALELALGVEGVTVDDHVRDDDGAARPFVVRVTVPDTAAVHAEFVERIVREEKAAHVVAEIVFADARDDAPVKVKVAIVVLVVLVVAVALVLFYGVVRPPGPPGGSRPGISSALGWLRSTQEVTFADLAESGADCVDRPTESFVVPGGTACRIVLPDSGSFSLCANEGPELAVAVVSGRSFPDQPFDTGDLGCGDPAQVSVYDEESTLDLGCGLTGSCRFVVGPPDE